MWLIYINRKTQWDVNPIVAVRDIRETFGRNTMKDEETVASYWVVTPSS